MSNFIKSQYKALIVVATVLTVGLAWYGLAAEGIPGNLTGTLADSIETVNINIEKAYFTGGESSNEIFGHAPFNVEQSFDEGIAVDGTTLIDGSGNITGLGNASSTGYISIGGDDATDDDYLYFDTREEYLLWDYSQQEFSLSDDLAITGDASTTGDFWLGNLDAEDDDTLYFDASSSEWIMWDDSPGEFDISDDVVVGGNVSTTGDIIVGGDVGNSDNVIYFDSKEENWTWDDSASLFLLTDDMQITGSVSSTEYMSVGGDDGSDDDYLYFDTREVHLAWINSEGKFYFSDPLATTTLPQLDYTKQTSMVWTTSTYGFATADDPTVFVKVQNTGADLLCMPPVADISTAATSIGYSGMTVGTTTATGDSSLTNTTTDTLIASTAVASSSSAILSPTNAGQAGSWYDGGGNATNTPWVWTHGDYLVMSAPDAGGATSSDDTTSEGGFTGVGRLHVECRNRY